MERAPIRQPHPAFAFVPAHRHFFSSGHSLRSAGIAASAAGIVRTILK
jgi:hypothetical protein